MNSEARWFTTIAWLCMLMSAFPAEDLTETQFGFACDREFVRNTATLVFNEPLQRRIREIGCRLIAASSKPDVKCTFRVLNNPTINAAAIPGFIYLNTGVLDVCDQEDEVAAVLAHEVGHIVKSDLINRIRAENRNRLTGQIIAGLFAVGAAVGGGMASAPSSSHSSPGQSPRIQTSTQLFDLGLQIGSLAGGALANSMTKGYGRGQELAADAYSIQCLKKAGYDPNALIRTFKKLMAARDKLGINPNNYASALINAQPGLEERLKNADKLFASQGR